MTWRVLGLLCLVACEGTECRGDQAQFRGLGEHAGRYGGVPPDSGQHAGYDSGTPLACLPEELACVDGCIDPETTPATVGTVAWSAWFPMPVPCAKTRAAASGSATTAGVTATGSRKTAARPRLAVRLPTPPAPPPATAWVPSTTPTSATRPAPRPKRPATTPTKTAMGSATTVRWQAAGRASTGPTAAWDICTAPTSPPSKSAARPSSSGLFLPVCRRAAGHPSAVPLRQGRPHLPHLVEQLRDRCLARSHHRLHLDRCHLR